MCEFFWLPYRQKIVNFVENYYLKNAMNQSVASLISSPDCCNEFTLWSPDAQGAKVLLYDEGVGGKCVAALAMTMSADGMWRVPVPPGIEGKFYAFKIKHRGRWLAETPGPWATAVGVNGRRGAIISMPATNPEGWDNDHGPHTVNITDAVIYELHHRDFSAHVSSGITHKGKFLALTEADTRTYTGESTGLAHLKELGVTHVQIMPSFDFVSVDESMTDEPQYNWGYDPQNYNVPEGSYATDAADPSVRICEMKRMIMALHGAGIGVVMDVVYNHTAGISDSCFSLTAPGYYYRRDAAGGYSNASGCGNETASEHPMMRRFIVESVKYWAREYHIDGFRFDLMGVHDIDTMLEVSRELKRINPHILLYGEGWTAADSPYPSHLRALKDNADKLPDVAMFSDVMRDTVRGYCTNDAGRGFATGKPGLENALKECIVGGGAPARRINYVSCHDDLCLTDKLALSMPKSSVDKRMKMARLAQTIVFTSQGVPFMLAGEEMFRTKRGVANSYNSPDSINAIDWDMKHAFREHFDYYAQLIMLRRMHPAFRMASPQQIAHHIAFDDVSQPNVVSYAITGHANSDDWAEIKVVFNGSARRYTAVVAERRWRVIARGGKIKAQGLGFCKGGSVVVAPYTALILAWPTK